LDKRVADVWFGVEYHGEEIWRLREAHIDPFLAGDIWLVRGRDRALVVDSGTGIRSPVPLIEALSGKPVIAVALNCFYDHAGGLHHFSERACHPGDAAAIAEPSDATSLSGIYVRDSMFSALPEAGYQASDYRMRGAAPTRLLEEGDVIDLGNRRIEVLHTPGMTPGSLCLWERETGSLFTSDTMYDDPMDSGLDPTDAARFAESLKRLREVPASQVYGGHFGRMSRARMLEVIDGYFAR
jgi:glyoxylase-like metal-dependent hydrolase (beta-lactamase superfamily II)